MKQSVPAPKLRKSHIWTRKPPPQGVTIRRDFTVEACYCNTARVLAAAGIGVSVVDPFSPHQHVPGELIVRTFVPNTAAAACVMWSKAQPLSRLAKSFLAEILSGART